MRIGQRLDVEAFNCSTGPHAKVQPLHGGLARGAPLWMNATECRETARALEQAAEKLDGMPQPSYRQRLKQNERQVLAAALAAAHGKRKPSAAAEEKVARAIFEARYA